MMRQRRSFTCFRVMLESSEDGWRARCNDCRWRGPYRDGSARAGKDADSHTERGMDR